MPKLLIALVASLAAMNLHGATPEQARLLVSIMVDGLDADYLDLLREQFGEGGFKRLEREGVSLTADYGTPLDAAASAATVATGAAPSISGIGGATRYDREHLRPVEVYADAEVLGNFTSTGYSPRALRVTNLADELRIASGGTNVAYNVAPTPGEAISLAGHASNSAIWLDKKTCNWASSTAYQEMPASVATRNRAVPLNMRLDTMCWTPSLAPNAYPALPDHLTRYPFRYVFPRANSERLDMFMASPLLNREITALASELIRTQKLGTHEGVTDVLNIAYHIEAYPYGKSDDKRVELMDSYIKLDRNLEQLFADIDKVAGKGNSIVLLAATPPRNTRRRDDEKWNIPTGEFSTRRAISLLNIYLMALYGNGDFVSAYHNGQIYLNQRLIKELKLDLRAVRAEAASFLAKMTGIDRVHTLDNIADGRAGLNPDALRRNTVTSTAGDLVIEPAPGFEVVDDYNNISATGGKGNVQITAAATAPVFIMAPGVAAQTIDVPVDARSIAPTVARVLRIRSPNGAGAPPVKLEHK